MINRLISRLIFFLIVMPLSAVGLAQADEGVVLTVVGNHAPPYRIIEGDHYSGIYFDTMSEIARRMEIQVRYKSVPFKRALYMMRYGDADIMLGPNRNAEREAYMVYTDAVFPSEDKAFYVHPVAADIRRYEDLEGLRVLVHQGKVYFDRFDNDKALYKQPTAKYEYAIRKVANCPVCVVIMPEQEGDYLLKKMRIKLKKAPYKAKGNISYITLSNKSLSVDLQQEIEHTMEDLKVDGTFARIVEQYK
ncbi:MAG: transporter substrate-binding domain-containing protein [Sedimenticola sp.]